MPRVCPECGTETDALTCPQDGEMTLVVRKKDAGDAGRIGQVIGGRYRILQIIGQGGFGAVYKAQHTATGDTVAIKLLRTEVAESEGVAARFRHEAKATSRLKHPNTVRVFDFGQMDDGNLFLAMEFLEGRTFTELMRSEGPLEPKRLVHIAVQVLKSLSEAHSKSLIHRDLKPDNIFLQQVHGEPDFVKVLDFGIAKSLAGNASVDVTSTGAIIGTPRYMSPEQARGVPVDARTDLYALGIILYEGLSGVAPFLADSPLSMLLRRVQEAPPRVHDALALPTPQGVCDAVLLALGRDPIERFASADAMAAALVAGLGTPVLPARTYVAMVERPSRVNLALHAMTMGETADSKELSAQIALHTGGLPLKVEQAPGQAPATAPAPVAGGGLVQGAGAAVRALHDEGPTRLENQPPGAARAAGQSATSQDALAPTSAGTRARGLWLAVGGAALVIAVAVAVVWGRSAPEPVALSAAPAPAVLAGPTPSVALPAQVAAAPSVPAAAPTAAASAQPPATQPGAGDASVRIVREPADAAVEIGGTQILASEVRLPAGTHKLTVSKPGWQTQVREFVVQPGQASTVEVVLTRKAKVGSTEAVKPEPTPVKPDPKPTPPEKTPPVKDDGLLIK